MSNVYLEHHGIKGQRWGVRRYQNEDGSLTSVGAKRYGNANTVIRRAKAEKKESNRQSLNRFKNDLDNLQKSGKGNDNAAIIKRSKQYDDERRAASDTYKQIKQVAKGKHVQQKQYGQLEDSYIYKKKVKEKDLVKTYGRLEDSINYKKHANKKANAYVEKALDEIDKQISQTGKKPTYDVEKINDLIEKAMTVIDNDLDKYRR